jgi:hypothetical protein
MKLLIKSHNSIVVTALTQLRTDIFIRCSQGLKIADLYLKLCKLNSKLKVKLLMTDLQVNSTKLK